MKGIRIIAFLVGAITLGSCAQQEDYYSLNDIWLSLGIMDTNNPLGYDYVLYCDNGDTLLPAVNSVPYFEAKDSQRVLINYTILDEVGTSTKKFYVKINNLQDVLFKDVIEMNATNADSLGQDSITINKLWVVKDLMNVEFTYLGGIERHYINMAYSLNENGTLDQPVQLEFRHNANNDAATILLSGIVTFRLNKLQVPGQDSVNFVVRSTGLLDGDQSFTGTYSY